MIPNRISIIPRTAFIISDHLKSNMRPMKTFVIINDPHASMINLLILFTSKFTYHPANKKPMDMGLK